MNLVIDIGNTRTKLAVFENKELKGAFIYSDDLKNILDTFSISNAIISSVKNNDVIIDQLPKSIKVIEFTNHSKLPIKNLYETKQTLGIDRLAAAIGGNNLFPNSNVLVIDAGTCIKYNFTNGANEYLGGAISPGLQMRARALHTFTDKLPLIELKYDYNTLIGTSTQNSLLTGIMTAALLEVQGFIAEYQKEYPDLKIIITGGDASFFEKQLKSNIFAHPNLLLEGLNTILLLNE